MEQTKRFPAYVVKQGNRAIRAEDDTARFYVVDGNFIGLVRNTWHFIPEWGKAALPATLRSGFDD